MAHRAIPTILLILCTVAATSCGDGRPPRVPVSGQVLIDGKPLSFGMVMFVPPDARASVAKLDADGKFSLSCFDPMDGAVRGQHQVQVNAGEPVTPTKMHWHAPKKYANFNRSGLTQEITGPTDSLVINLTWAGKKPYDEILGRSDTSGTKTKAEKTPQARRRGD